jgi:hypothetical protein
MEQFKAAILNQHFFRDRSHPSTNVNSRLIAFPFSDSFDGSIAAVLGDSVIYHFFEAGRELPSAMRRPFVSFGKV